MFATTLGWCYPFFGEGNSGPADKQLAQRPQNVPLLNIKSRIQTQGYMTPNYSHPLFFKCRVFNAQFAVFIKGPVFLSLSCDIRMLKILVL